MEITSLCNILEVQGFKVTQPSPFQKVKWDVEKVAITVNGDSFRSGIDQFSLEFAPVINGRTGSYVDDAS